MLSVTFWGEITLPHGNEIISPKAVQEKQNLQLHWWKIPTFNKKNLLLSFKKVFLTSFAYRRCFQDLFHKSVRALLGLIGEAHITLSKVITLIQRFLPQQSSWSACNCLVSYLNASFTSMKTCESHLCWLTSYSAQQKRTEGNFTIGVTMATAPARPPGSSSLHILQPNRCSTTAPAGNTSPPIWGCFTHNVLVSTARKSEVQDPPDEQRKGWESLCSDPTVAQEAIL